MFLAADPAPYDRGPFSDFWYEPVTGKTGAGARVTDDQALRLAVLYACVNVISQDLAKVPLNLFAREDNGNRRLMRASDHWVVGLLRQPTPQMNGIDWKQREEAHQLLRGNSYAHMQTGFGGRVRAMPTWRPDLVRVETMSDGSLRYHVTDPNGGPERTYVEGEVLHQRGLSLDGPLGLSPIDQARETLGEAVNAQMYGASFFANDARPSIWLKHPSNFKNDSTRNEWLARFRRMFGGSNRFSPMLTEYGITIENLPPPDHASLQFLELRKLKANEICAIFRVPPHKVAILERSTNNNIEHQGIEYVTDCLLTHCRRWEESLAQHLLTEAEREEFYFEFNLDSLMRGDTLSRFQAYESAVAKGGWLLRNEARRKENLPAVDGLDEPLMPVNTFVVGEPRPGAPAVPGAGAEPDGDEAPPAEPTTTPGPDDGETPDDAQNARARMLELQARRRVLTRETRALAREWERSAGNPAAFADGVTSFYAWHAAFVAKALVIPPLRAAAYCMAQVAEVERAIGAGSVDAMLAAWEADAQTMQFSPIPPAPEPEQETKT